jgi:hypothetical protein
MDGLGNASRLGLEAPVPSGAPADVWAMRESPPTPSAPFTLAFAKKIA